VRSRCPRLQQEAAAGLVVGFTTAAVVGVATANPLNAMAAGTIAGTATALNTGAWMEFRKQICLRIPNCVP